MVLAVQHLYCITGYGRQGTDATHFESEAQGYYRAYLDRTCRLAASQKRTLTKLRRKGVASCQRGLSY